MRHGYEKHPARDAIPSHVCPRLSNPPGSPGGKSEKILTIVTVIAVLTSAFSIVSFAAKSTPPSKPDKPKITKAYVVKGDDKNGKYKVRVGAEWEKAKNAKKYIVDYNVSTGTGKYKKGTFKTKDGETSFEIPGIPVKKSGTYTVRVRSVDKSGKKKSGWSEKITKKY